MIAAVLELGYLEWVAVVVVLALLWRFRRSRARR